MTQRADQWLCFARLCKSRTIGAGLIQEGRLRINGEICKKPSATLKTGDVITLAYGRNVRVLKVLSDAARRGPASEAQTLYEDLTPAPAPAPAGTPLPPAREPGAGRPTKRDRRQLDAFTSGEE
jgi:ribosome-associated heat shock protein Hsp15